MTVDSNLHLHLENFFHIASKLTIITPIVIVILALVLKYNQPRQNIGKNLPTASLEPTIVLNTPEVSSLGGKLNLTGPFVCQFSSNEASIGAFIKDKKILVKFKENRQTRQQNYLLSGDCLYIFDDGDYSGEKVCGLSPYIKLVDNLLAGNLLSFNSILGNLTQFVPLPKSLNNIDYINSLVNSCKKKELEGQIFDLPRNILFKNKK